jgi:hypothetical protein
MTIFRLILAAWLAVLTAYTAVVIANHGFGLFEVFFGDILSMGWPGQFNLDFLGFLFLSGLWVSWRHHFSPAGLALGVVALLGGIPFLTIYLLVVSRAPDCDMKMILLGSQRALG